jgi:hypothetical protein
MFESACRDFHQARAWMRFLLTRRVTGQQQARRGHRVRQAEADHPTAPRQPLHRVKMPWSARKSSACVPLRGARADLGRTPALAPAAALQSHAPPHLLLPHAAPARSGIDAVSAGLLRTRQHTVLTRRWGCGRPTVVRRPHGVLARRYRLAPEPRECENAAVGDHSLRSARAPEGMGRAAIRGKVKIVCSISPDRSGFTPAARHPVQAPAGRLLLLVRLGKPACARSRPAAIVQDASARASRGVAQ